MKKMALGWLIPGCACAVMAAPPPFEIRQPDYRTYDFEESAIPAEFSAGPGSRLTLTSEYSSTGRQALRWDWEGENAELRYHSPEAFRHLTGENPDPIVYEWVTYCTLSAFTCRIFSEKPLGGALWMELGGSRFYVNMNFSGWADAALLYGRDLAVFPRPGSDTLIIRPPRGVTKGTIYIDAFAPRRELDVRAVLSTSRMPYVKNRELRSDQERYLPAGRDRKFSVGLRDYCGAQRVPEAPAALSQEQQAMIRRMSDEFLSRYRVKAGLASGDWVKIAGMRSAMALRRNNSFVSGNIGKVSDFYNDMLLAGRALKSGKLTAEQQRETLALIEDMADLAIQQGHGGFYVLRTSFIAPLLLLRQELENGGRYQALVERLRVITEFEEFYQESPWGNADVYNTLLSARAGLIFLEEDPRVQWRDLQALRHWLDATAKTGEIMPDGTFTHHRMVYTGYSFPAIGPICQVLYLTRGTPFFSERMYQLAGTALLNMSYYAVPYSPNMFAGRWRNCDRFTWEMAGNLALLAQCGKGIDPRYASRYLAFADLYRKNSSETKKFRAAGISVDPMQGAQAQNYAVALVHRHGNVTAVVRGQRDGLFANEAYADAGGNTMGRYLNYGQLQVLDGAPEDNGFVLDKGWDFNFWPGTTARQLPPDALRQHFENVEGFTAEYFAGATALDGCGVWAMKLQEELPGAIDPLRLGPPRYWLGDKEYAKRCSDSRYDVGFKARKSMFCFGGVIVALGSGIVSSDKEAPVVTTLAQNSLEKVRKDQYQEGENWVIDAVGNGYYFDSGKPVIQRGKTVHPYYKNWKPNDAAIHNQREANAGAMELIYFNHGARPDMASYRYFMLLRPGAKAMKEFAAGMKAETAPFTVLRQDQGAHIVRRNADGMTGYVMFDSGESGNGKLESVDQPCMVMLTEQEGNKLKLALFNPRFDDLSRPEQPLQRQVVTRIKLAGNWKTTAGADRIRVLSGSEFEIINRDLIPTTVEFFQ